MKINRVVVSEGKAYVYVDGMEDVPVIVSERQSIVYQVADGEARLSFVLADGTAITVAASKLA